MFKKSCVLVVSVGILAIGVSAYAMNKTDKGVERSIIIIGGKVTNIKGNVITIKDNKGLERVFEVSSTAGLKVGTPVICEEDCGHNLKIGDQVVNVQKVIKR